jgi:hypothetical protein
MYMVCTVSLLLVYIGWTVSMAKSMEAIAIKKPNDGAVTATLFFIYAYTPAYNIGYNALTYSKQSPPLGLRRMSADQDSQPIW